MGVTMRDFLADQPDATAPHVSQDDFLSDQPEAKAPAGHQTGDIDLRDGAPAPPPPPARPTFDNVLTQRTAARAPMGPPSPVPAPFLPAPTPGARTSVENIADAPLFAPGSIPSRLVGALGDAAMHPLATAGGLLWTPMQAALTLTAPGVGESRPDPRLSKGGRPGYTDAQAAVDASTPYTAETGGVTPKERAIAAAQLAALGLGPEFEGLLMSAAKPFVGQLANAGMMDQALMLSRAAAVAARTATGAGIGAIYSPNDPTVGAILGATIGGVHSLLGGDAVVPNLVPRDEPPEVPVERRIADQSAPGKTTITGKVAEEPAPAHGPDYTVEDITGHEPPVSHIPTSSDVAKEETPPVSEVVKPGSAPLSTTLEEHAQQAVELADPTVGDAADRMIWASAMRTLPPADQAAVRARVDFLQAEKAAPVEQNATEEPSNAVKAPVARPVSQDEFLAAPEAIPAEGVKSTENYPENIPVAGPSLEEQVVALRAENEALKTGRQPSTAAPVSAEEFHAGEPELANEDAHAGFNPEEASTSGPALQGARDSGGVLKRNLTKVSDDDLTYEYAQSIDANAQENTAGHLARDENFHTMNDGRSFLVTGQAGMKARGRVQARNQGLARIEAELAKRGIDHADAYIRGNQNAKNFEDPTAFFFSDKGDADLFGNSVEHEPAQGGLFGEKAGTEESRGLKGSESAARGELDKLRQQFVLEKEPVAKATIARRMADLDRLVNRGGKISAEEMATRATGNEAPKVPTGPGQGALFDSGGEKVTDSPAFKRWFGASKVVDGQGEPMVVYHGTGEKFTTFKRSKATQGIFWFTNDRSAIESGDVGAQGRGHVMDLYASLKNPAGWDEYHKYGLGQLRSMGYDGAILPESDGTLTGFAFEPTQLKSASRNRGTFDPSKASIIADHADQADLFARVAANPEGPDAIALARQTVDHSYGVERYRRVARDLAPYVERLAKTFGSTAERTALLARLPDHPWADLTGADVSTVASLRAALSVMRHPGAESLSVLLHKDGVVQHHIVLSSGAVNVVRLDFDKLVQQIAEHAKTTGASDVIFAHNHPAGDPSPSSGDRYSNALLEQRLKDEGIVVSGHMIIDHDTATWMTPGEGTAPWHEKHVRIPGVDAQDWRTTFARGLIPANARNISFLTREALSPDATTILYRDTRGRIMAAEGRSSLESPADLLRHVDQQRTALKAYDSVLAAGDGRARQLRRHAMDARGQGLAEGHYVSDVLAVTPSGTVHGSQVPKVSSGIESGDFPAVDAEWRLAHTIRTARQSQPAGTSERAGSVADRGPAGVLDEPPDEPIFGIKNSDSATQRERLGMDERTAPEPRTQEEMYDAGKSAVARDQGVETRLMEELRSNPEKIVGTKEEAGVLLKMRVDLENRLNHILEQRAAAKAVGNVEGEQLADLQLADHRARAREFTQLVERTGTATGRALAARKMMSTLDYSLSTMVANAEAAKGAPLDTAELERVKAIRDELATKLTAAENDLHEAKERAAVAESALAHATLKLEIAGPIADRITKRLDTAAQAAKLRLRARGLRATAGVDPEVLADYAIIGASEIARGARAFSVWSKSMLEHLGNDIAPHLQEIFDASTKALDAEIANEKPSRAKPQRPEKAEKTGSADEPTTPAEKFAAGVEEGATLDELGSHLREMALEHIRNGTTDRAAVIRALHRQVEPYFEHVTTEEVRDALSGYGKFYPMDKSADVQRLREIRAESQKLAQLEALERGEAPLATGSERAAPNDETRRLQQQVNAAKKAAGIGGQDDATRLKSALSAAKTRARNAISDMQAEIDSGKRIVAGKVVRISDPELEALRSQVAGMRQRIVDVFGKRQVSDEQRLATATAAAKRNAEDWEKRAQMAQGGSFAPRGQRNPLTSPEIDLARAQAKAARAQYEELKALNPAEQQKTNAVQNAAYRARLAEREADLLSRMARNDYSKNPVRPGMTMDRETLARKAAVEEVKQRYQEQLRKFEAANRSVPEKIRHGWAGWVRAGALSWPTVIAKLTSVALSRMVTTPATDLVALGVAKALPGLARGAPRYGSSVQTALRAEAKAQAAQWVDGIKNAGRRLANQRTDLDLLHGRDRLPQPLWEYFGQIHGALKEPIKMAEYARSLQRRTEHAILSGEDTTDPLVQLRLSTEAYEDAERSISMQKNSLVDWFNGAIGRLDDAKFKNGEPNLSLRLLATAIKTELPIVKVPMNIVKEASDIILGGLTGPAKAAWAYHKGIEHLEPVERDAIIRLIAAGAIGAAMVAIGFFKAKDLGGYYQPGEKRSKQDVPFGALGVGGHVVPAMLLHNPFMWAAQFGATIRRVAESRGTKAEHHIPKGIGAGVLAGSLGVLKEIPFVRETSTIADATDPRKTGSVVDRAAASKMVPGVVQWIATNTDPLPDNRKRTPTGLGQSIENDIPGLRQRVPETRVKVNNRAVAVP